MTLLSTFLPMRQSTNQPLRDGRILGRSRLPNGVIAAAMALSSGVAMAAPCDNMNLPLRSSDRTALDTEIAKQLNVGQVAVQQSYGNSQWSVFYVTTDQNDQTFVVYEGDPITTRYQALWGGSPTDYTDDQILNWTRTNVTGIPEPLAECLSWAMRQDRQT